MSTLPTSGPYLGILQGFLGYLTPAEQQAIWNQFLTTNGLTTPPPANDVAQLTNFSGFVSQIYQDYEASLPLLTGDAGKTRIVLTIFDIIITMMRSMNDSQKTMQENVSFWVKKQNEYTQLAVKTPFYEGHEPYGSPLPSDIVYNADPAKYTLGYGGLTMKDVLDYLASSNARDANGVLTPTNSHAVNMALYPATSPVKYLNFTTTRDSGAGTFRLVVNLMTKGSPNDILEDSVQQILNDSLSLADKSAGMAVILPILFGRNAVLMSNVPGIPWPVFQGIIKGVNVTTPIDIRFTAIHPGGATDLPTALTNDIIQQKALVASQLRAEANAQLNTLLDALKTKKDILTDLSDSSQRTVGAAGQGLQQMANIYKAIITNLNNIMNSLFK